MDSSSPAFEKAASVSYSFIIIGGGTAGLALAARLTETPHFSVLVLEAGENKLDDPKVDIPAFLGQLYEDPNYDWCLKSVPQPALNGRIIAQPRGKLLGGSSAINFMMATHPSKRDIDNWGRLGNPSWTWESLLPYYRKSEALKLPPSMATNPAERERLVDMGLEVFDPEIYGHTGPVQLTMPHATSMIDSAWRPTLTSLGVGVLAGNDPRKGDTMGGYAALKLIDDSHRRNYSARAYYEPVKERTNLTVLTGALVKRLIASEAPIKVTDVLFETRGKQYIVKADKEVILSAGSFASPQILELSGIGSSSILHTLGIPVLVDNPGVGENLQDHPLAAVNYEVHEGLPTAESIRQPGVLDWALEEWKAGRGGPLTTGVSGTGFMSHSSILGENMNPVSSADKLSMSTDSSTLRLQILKEMISSPTEADVQFNFAATGFDPYQGAELSKVLGHSDPGNYIGAAVVLTHPVSRGSSHITSLDPNASPAINPNFLAEPIDFDMATDGILFLEKVFETKPMAEFVKNREDGLSKKMQPSYGIDKRMDKQTAEQLVRRATISSWHPIGTCSMMPRELGGVVDERLRVYGIVGLRVVDASIMPLLVRGNIASSVYAIAEKAADMIKEDWNIAN